MTRAALYLRNTQNLLNNENALLSQTNGPSSPVFGNQQWHHHQQHSFFQSGTHTLHFQFAGPCNFPKCREPKCKICSSNTLLYKTSIIAKENLVRETCLPSAVHCALPASTVAVIEILHVWFVHTCLFPLESIYRPVVH